MFVPSSSRFFARWNCPTVTVSALSPRETDWMFSAIAVPEASPALCIASAMRNIAS